VARDRIKKKQSTKHLLEGDESGRVGRTNSGASVSDGSVSDGELTKVVSHHLGLDIDVVEHLAVVDSDLGMDHLGDDKHVAKVGLDNSGLVKDTALSLGLAELLDESHGLSLEASLHASSGTGMNVVQKFLVAQVKKLVKLNSAEHELLELSLLTKSSDRFDIHISHV